MAQERGGKERGDKSADAPPAPERDSEEQTPDAGPLLTGIPDLMRKALSMGFSGFFLTEETIRKALGDTLPKDWVDFAVDQSDRTRREFLERLTYEMGRTLENVDLAAVLQELLEGRTLEVKAEIRLGSKESGPGTHKLQVAAKGGRRGG